MSVNPTNSAGSGQPGGSTGAPGIRMGANLRQNAEIQQLVQNLKDLGASTEQIQQAFDSPDVENGSPFELLEQLQQNLTAGSNKAGRSATGSAWKTDRFTVEDETAESSQDADGDDQFTPGEIDASRDADEAGDAPQIQLSDAELNGDSLADDPGDDGPEAVFTPEITAGLVVASGDLLSSLTEKRTFRRVLV